MDVIFVVEGVTGEYEDRQEWAVCAFSTKDAAQGLCDRLNAWCKEQGCEMDAETVTDFTVRTTYDFRPEEDPHFSCSFTGVGYRIYEIPFGG